MHFLRALRHNRTSEPGFLLEVEPLQTVRVLDVAFVCEERIPLAEEEGRFWLLALDLAVEIISPSERADEIQAEADGYLGAGVRLIWLVYPKRQVVME